MTRKTTTTRKTTKPALPAGVTREGGLLVIAKKRAPMTAEQTVAARRSLAAVRAHASRAAIAILGGAHDEDTVARFEQLSTEADRLASQLELFAHA
jgi:hypothetical protein